MGEIQAGMWRDVGQIAGNTIQSVASHYADEPARKQAQEIRDLQLGEARAGVAAREAEGQRAAGFQQTMGSGRSRADILKALEADPDQYRMASEHFGRIDTGYKRLMGDVAAGVRAFGDSPDAALIAIDDLIAKGFDERQMEQYRAAIQKDPANVSALIDGLLQGSPDEAHRKLVVPKKEPGTRLVTTRGADGTETSQIVADTPGQTFTSAAEVKPDTRSLQVQANDALKAGNPNEYARIMRVIRDSASAGRAPVQPGSGPSRFWVMRNGEAVRISEAEYQQGDKPAGGAAGTGRPATGAQNRVLGFFNRAQQADGDLETLEADVQKMGLGGQTRMATMPNVLQSDLGQKYTQAQRAFTEARLRKDSGAAIPNHEYDNDRKTYFAQPGDSQTTLEQKRQARAAVLASLAFEAGPALAGFLGDETEAAKVVETYKARAGKKTVDPLGIR
ncbi:MAG: hypothetical protein M3Q55_02595 [Acidobacteriota bacterium]|nr:hypothetical protein [Acidobacteriota bacterium]